VPETVFIFQFVPLIVEPMVASDVNILGTFHCRGREINFFKPRSGQISHEVGIELVGG
jgi:hypothetical protein